MALKKNQKIIQKKFRQKMKSENKVQKEAMYLCADAGDNGCTANTMLYDAPK